MLEFTTSLVAAVGSEELQQQVRPWVFACFGSSIVSALRSRSLTCHLDMHVPQQEPEPQLLPPDYRGATMQSHSSHVRLSHPIF